MLINFSPTTHSPYGRKQDGWQKSSNLCSKSDHSHARTVKREFRITFGLIWSSASRCPFLLHTKQCFQYNVGNLLHRVQTKKIACRCLDSFCDPHKVTEVSTHDLMKCALWDTEMFRYLADRKYHSPLCQDLCSETDLNITLEYFSCIAYMSDISSCMREGYNVLLSNPVNFRISLF